MVIPRNCMLRQGACWVGMRTPAREQLLEPGRRGGVGEGYYMYILYTEYCSPGLRKALPERWSCYEAVRHSKSLGVSQGGWLAQG